MLPSISSSHHRISDQAVNEKIKNIDINEILKQITKIKQSIGNNNFFKEDLSQMDKKLMPLWVDMANKNKDGLNLSYVNTPDEFLEKIKSKKELNDRYIIKTSPQAAHCAVIDAKSVNGKPSVLLFESARPNSDSSGILAFQIRLALEKINLDAQFCVIDLDIQRSHYDCAIFSLAIAKKIHKHEEAIFSLHQYIADNEMTNPNFEGVVRKKISDKFLPADFYKHTQSKNRIKEYLETNPENANRFINKKNERITDVMNTRFVEVNDDGKNKSISKSIHLKRLVELNRLRDLVQNQRSRAIDLNSEGIVAGDNH